MRTHIDEMPSIIYSQIFKVWFNQISNMQNQCQPYLLTIILIQKNTTNHAEIWLFTEFLHLECIENCPMWKFQLRTSDFTKKTDDYTNFRIQNS